ncbi:hypothetical protein WSS15_29590 [Acetobacter pasteurianus]|uniref:Uncharacterized protein n=2 Tax=Acetobacter pasteurianus TaxID=438 RepID=A0A401WXA9_ACEPA|nr:hypothetical protein NBRC3188_2686 [Acetobacter pasteurianus NBRC 3188]GCD60287.1 hypothetical protein NBRC3277_2862 [Acetobacter pasteurianus NBRC 3277]GCD63637.1 hypothetical protein NBRC3278_2730 [Acetobacter pasteurianus NBRC 3278]GCD70045.1 hypothetical protein NBRC3280_2680 [Acetobacter pasteurianus NBRC 3280]GLH30309.1 hypothetical protein WSS15_29590 [Acetobacter pasteurianus]
MAHHYPLFGFNIAEGPIPETSDVERLLAIDGIPCLAEASVRDVGPGYENAVDHSPQNPEPGSSPSPVAPEHDPGPMPIPSLPGSL